MSKTVKHATDADFGAVVLGSANPVIVDFWAPWCAPCRMQGPILERFASSHPGVDVVKVNVDESPGIARQLGIRSIPTIAVFEGGDLKQRKVGVQDEGSLGAMVAAA